MPIRIDDNPIALNAIYDRGAFIQVRLNAKDSWVNKASIRAIQIVSESKLYLDTGDNPLQHLYISSTDITHPESFALAADLANYISSLISTSGDGLSLIKLEMVITELQQIKQTVEEIKTLLEIPTPPDENTPTLVDTSQIGYIYKGYLLPTTDTKEAAWKIARISQFDMGKQITLWADGNMNYDNYWEERYVISYMPLDDIVISPRF